MMYRQHVTKKKEEDNIVVIQRNEGERLALLKRERKRVILFLQKEQVKVLCTILRCGNPCQALRKLAMLVGKVRLALRVHNSLFTICTKFCYLNFSWHK